MLSKPVVRAFSLRVVFLLSSYWETWHPDRLKQISPLQATLESKRDTGTRAQERGYREPTEPGDRINGLWQNLGARRAILFRRRRASSCEHCLPVLQGFFDAVTPEPLP